jgi:hypothetical protein
MQSLVIEQSALEDDIKQVLNYLPELDLKQLIYLQLLYFIAKVNPELERRVTQLQISFLQHQEHHLN